MSCGKLSYVSKQEAMGVIRAISRTARKYRHAQATNAYQCDVCEGRPWHVGRPSMGGKKRQ